MTASELYPLPRPEYSLHLTAAECTLFQTVRQTNLPRASFGFRVYNQWKVPQFAADYLVRCDGRRTHGEIAAVTSAGFHPTFGQVLAEQAARLLSATGVLDFVPTPTEQPGTIQVTGGFDSYAPLHISFEITDTCNFRCAHCYVSASPEKHGRKNGVETIETLRNLARSGVRVIELTGGECTTHPEFKEILQYAAETFHIVGIISNGFLLGKRPDLAEFVASYDNALVQISIDGLRDFHDRFRAMPGSFDAACEAVRALKRYGTFVRIGMSVTTENIDQVLGVFHLAKELGVDSLGVAATTSFGRGIEVAGCAQTERGVNHLLNEILAPYSEDPLFDAVKRERKAAAEEKQVNCGAGWRSFALNSDGTVRSCLFLADSKKFGNIDRQDYDAVFRQHEMQLFHDAPSPGGPECQGPQPDGSASCKYLGICIGCFAKAFRISEEDYPECPWRNKYFPGMSLKMQVEPAFVSLDQLRRPTSGKL